MRVIFLLYNTHKQRTLPIDERPFKGSNGHETDINGWQKWHSFLIRRLMWHSCDTALLKTSFYNISDCPSKGFLVIWCLYEWFVTRNGKLYNIIRCRMYRSFLNKQSVTKIKSTEITQLKQEGPHSRSQNLQFRYCMIIQLIQTFVKLFYLHFYSSFFCSTDDKLSTFDTDL